MTVDNAERGNLVKTWFIVLGAVLLLFAVLGTFGVGHPLGGAGPVGTAAPTGPIHLDGGETAVHGLLGLATLGIAFLVKERRMLTTIAWVFGAVYVLVGVVGFVMPVVGPWHLGVGDNVLHLVVGLANFGVAWASRDRMDVVAPTRNV